MAKAIAQRGAVAGIYLSRTPAGLGVEVGDWSEGRCAGGPYIATVHENLVTAIRLLIGQSRLAAERAVMPIPDVVAVEGELTRIRTALQRVKEINRKASTAGEALDDIKEQAELLRIEVREALTKVEEALRVVPEQGVA